VEYALVAHWRAAGLMPDAPPVASLPAAKQIAVVSGSCSPVTARQIAHAEGCGFTGIRIDVNRAVDATGWEAEIGRITALALAALGTGASPLVYTARGPEDEAIAGLADACRSAGVGTSEVNDRIGAGLGSVLGQILDRGRLRRAVIAGGDTSG
ncbi:four-carbon acid sugar kinase family protein, partial [Cylindrospermopsis raciborskii CS-506_C]|nr:four-carbon acid sugar kinase family protein [Cylindrospermopsis raciborskii CS-506_C]